MCVYSAYQFYRGNKLQLSKQLCEITDGICTCDQVATSLMGVGLDSFVGLKYSYVTDMSGRPPHGGKNSKTDPCFSPL